MRFLPHVTVATIVEHQSRFLMVEEKRDGRIVLNQPAGHLEANETLLQAATRETLEETVIGIYLFQAANGETYQRVCFSAKPTSHDADRPLDEGIIRARWMTLDEIVDNSAQLRSYLVADCIRDYLNKPHYSLDLIR